MDPAGLAGPAGMGSRRRATTDVASAQAWVRSGTQAASVNRAPPRLGPYQAAGGRGAGLQSAIRFR